MYKIVGADQQEYGPVTSDQLREWIAQGRANSQSVVRFETGPWKPLGTFPEFADALRTAAPPTIAPNVPVGGYPLPGYPGAKTNTLAVTGLVLSVLGLCCTPVSLAGLVLSAIGLSQIQKNPQAYTTTKIIPIIGIALGILNILLVIVMYSTGMMDEMFRKLNLPQ